MDSATITIPTIVTPRLILRCWQQADLAPYAAMNQDEQTMLHLGGPKNHAATERLVTHLIGMWQLRGFGMWAVGLRADGSFAGRAGLYQTCEWPAPEAAWSIRGRSVPAVGGRERRECVGIGRHEAAAVDSDGSPPPLQRFSGASPAFAATPTTPVCGRSSD